MVQLNITTDYAIRLLLYLATVDRMAPSQEIAKEMNIPPKYITTIVAKLKEQSYVKTHQGSGGGYSLDCPPGAIILRDVVETIEGSIKINRCSHCNPRCILNVDDNCPLNDAYDVVQKTIEDVLSNVTVQDLVHKT